MSNGLLNNPPVSIFQIIVDGKKHFAVHLARLIFKPTPQKADLYFIGLDRYS